jgi:hypothetical protein
VVNFADVAVHDWGHVMLAEVAGFCCWVIGLVFVAEDAVLGCFGCCACSFDVAVAGRAAFKNERHFNAPLSPLFWCMFCRQNRSGHGNLDISRIRSFFVVSPL